MTQMNNNPKALSLLELQEANLEAVSIIVAEVKALLDVSEEDRSDPVVYTLRNLTKYLSDRSQAVSMLVSWGYAWDAEIILRSFYETAAKILFICFAEKDKRQELANEFWLEFEAIHMKKKHTKAERNIIEQRWSFSEIIEELSKINKDGKNLADIKGFLHIYGIASHLIHAEKQPWNLCWIAALEKKANVKF